MSDFDDLSMDEQDELREEAENIIGNAASRAVLRDLIANRRAADEAARLLVDLPDPDEEAERVYQAAIASGQRSDVAYAKAFEVRVAAAQAGDPRATWTPEKHMQASRD